jgi:hypothetical protein
VVGSMWVGDGDAETTNRTSLWLEDSADGRVSVKDVFSRIRSKRASPSALVLCLNDPPAVISSYRADFLLSPNHKC